VFVVRIGGCVVVVHSVVRVVGRNYSVAGEDVTAGPAVG